MPRYLVTAKWTAEGLAASTADGLVKRAAMTTALWEGLGGTVDAMYFAPATAEWDVIGIVDGVSSDAVFATANRVFGGGATVRVGAIELRTPEEADAAIARSAVAYVPPSG
jgi:uncharacterized protein with GYD domain